MRKRSAIVVFVAMLVTLAMALPAAAHSGFPQRLRRVLVGDAAASWRRGTIDSPLDANHARMRMEVVQSGDDFVNLWERGSGVRRAIRDVRNLSFDFHSGAHVGAGSPRISVEVDEDGDGTTDIVAFLAAFHCNNPIGGSVWHRADFTGVRAAGACTIFDGGGTPYTSDGFQSAWDVFVDAHGGLDRVRDAYVVMDETGTSFIDRIAFHNHMFTQGPNRFGNPRIVHCPTEGAC